LCLRLRLQLLDARMQGQHSSFDLLRLIHDARAMG
jgi:hypothetical protein